MSRLSTIPVALTLLLASAYVGTASAQVLGTEVDPASYGIETAQEATQKRARYARVNAAALDRAQVLVNLFGDLTFSATGGWAGRQLDRDIWTGTVDGEALSQVMFARSPSGLLFGKVETTEGTWLIQPKSGRIHAVVELDLSQLGNEAIDNDGVPLEPVDPEGLPQQDIAQKTAAESVCLASTVCPDQTIDVMVIYTAQARSVMGGTDEAAQTAIAAAVAEMNAAFQNSGLTHSIRLVHSGLVDYVESGDHSTDLSRLYSATDGYMDEVHAWRTTYGADLVSLVTDTGGCGIGYVQSNPTGYSSYAAFSAVDNGCLTGNKTLAHEMGHNMGLHHDWYVNSSTTPCEFNHGYVNQAAFGGSTSQRWRTIMAYNNQCANGGFNCTRLTYFSNPANLFGGDPMGVPQGQANPSDAAFLLQRAACQVAAFRASASPVAPVAQFDGSPLSGEAPLTVQFTDRSTGSPASWSWSFGDGGTSTAQSPSHTYVIPGTYSVSLTVANPEGSNTQTRTDYVTVTPPPVPPANPTDLAVTGTTSDAISLVWADNSTDEDGFRVERSPNGSTGWEVVASPGTNTTTFTDTGLAEGTTYHYRVVAYAGSAASGYAGPVSATTTVTPVVDHLASSVSASRGTVSGSLSVLATAGDGAQTVSETESGGNPKRRTSEAEVTWQFPVRAGFAATLRVRAWQEPAGDGDAFLLSYSDNGDVFTDLEPLPESEPGVENAFPLGMAAGATLWVRLRDTDRTAGNNALDRAVVDLLVVRTESSDMPPPGPPVDLTATAAGAYAIDLAWSSGGGESGYRVERQDGSAWTELALTTAPEYRDEGLTPSTNYAYRVAAFNAGGSSGYAQATATTGVSTDIPVHLAGLTADASGKKRWKMTVTAVVHDAHEAGMGGVTVSGTWSDGSVATCATDASGICSVQTFPPGPTETFTVTDLTAPGAVYLPSANHSDTGVTAATPDQARKDADGALPEAVTLLPNYPNPFNPSTVIEYGLPAARPVTVSVYNVLGMEVARLEDGPKDAGWHRVPFDASGLSSGVYLVVMRAGGTTLTRAMLLAK